VRLPSALEGAGRSAWQYRAQTGMQRRPQCELQHYSETGWSLSGSVPLYQATVKSSSSRPQSPLEDGPLSLGSQSAGNPVVSSVGCTSSSSFGQSASSPSSCCVLAAHHPSIGGPDTTPTPTHPRRGSWRGNDFFGCSVFLLLAGQFVVECVQELGSFNQAAGEGCFDLVYVGLWGFSSP
jgi:hypothetical protein